MIISFSRKHTPIKNFTIYGERHSGTNLLEDTVETAYGIKATWDFGWKHFFGYVHYSKIIEAQNTLFIGIARNPYDWIMAMYKKPYHIPNQNRTSIDALCLNEWYSIDTFYTSERNDDRSYVTHNRYKNIFDMRKNKLQYLMNYMPSLANHYCITTYEYLSDHKDEFIDIISKYYRLDIISYKTPKIHPRNQYTISKDVQLLIDNNIDWTIEKYFGFRKRVADT